MTSYLLFMHRWNRLKKNNRASGKFSRPIAYRVSPSGCYECVSHLATKDGYAIQGSGSQTILLHRAVYMAGCGEIAAGMIVRHDCDNPICIRFDHLRVGTHADNARDCNERGRRRRGSHCSWSKLTEDQVREIKRQRDRTAQSLAEEYGVRRGAIETIRSGRNWKEVAA